MDRTYGNWRRPKTQGLGPLGILPTVYLFIGSCFIIVIITTNKLLGLILMAGFSVTFLFFVIKVANGRSLIEYLYIALHWGKAKRKGENLYRSSIFSFSHLESRKHSCTLPGIASQFELVNYKTSERSHVKENFVVLHSKANNHYTLVFECEPNGLAPVDNEQIDIYVANWGRWLNSLSYEPEIVGASVVVQSARDFANDFKENIDNILITTSPEFSRQVMKEIKAQYSESHLYKTKTWITITYIGYDRATNRKLTAKKMLSNIESNYYNIKNNLAITGAGAISALEEPDLVRLIRAAYDPSSQELLENATTDDSLSFKDAGPIAHQEFWDYYKHDSGISSSWVMREAPRGVIHSNILNGAFRASQEMLSKRLAIHYRNFSVDESSRIVEQDKRRAMQQVTEEKRKKAKSLLDYRSAEQSAFEEAQGASLIRFSIVFTGTVSQDNRVKDIDRLISTMSASMRMRFSKAYGSQSATFLSSLPLGINLQNYASVPYILMRDSI
jgi:hypothetical protein